MIPNQTHGTATTFSMCTPNRRAPGSTGRNTRTGNEAKIKEKSEPGLHTVGADYRDQHHGDSRLDCGAEFHYFNQAVPRGGIAPEPVHPAVPDLAIYPRQTESSAIAPGPGAG